MLADLQVVSSVNPTTKIYTSVRGDIPNPISLVGSAKGEGAADVGILDEMGNLLRAVKKQEEEDAREIASQSHDHGHSHHASTSACSNTNCTDPTHDHDHGHGHEHGHSHDHHACAPSCNDPSHNHDHSHNHGCTDTHCNDPTHNHDHSHGHDHKASDETTAKERFGITSFVYKRRRPFHPVRFTNFLKGLGKLSIKDVQGLADFTALDLKSSDKKVEEARTALLRSKGFIWVSTSKSKSYFVSHAGQYLDLVVLGRWWSDIDKTNWPEGLESEIMQEFDGPHGDRRQELVFIGQFPDQTKSRQDLEELLDACLLTDEEMKRYDEVAPKGDDALIELFSS